MFSYLRTLYLSKINHTVLCLQCKVSIDEDTGLETMVIPLGGGVKKRITLNTHAVQQKAQVYKFEFIL